MKGQFIGADANTKFAMLFHYIHSYYIQYVSLGSCSILQEILPHVTEASVIRRNISIAGTHECHL